MFEPANLGSSGVYDNDGTNGIVYQSEDLHVTMENCKYRLFAYVLSKEIYSDISKSKNGQQVYNV